MEQKVASSKKPVKKVKAVASKRTMNFAYHESSINPKKLCIVLAIILVVGGVFAKFGILDQLAKKADAYTELALVQDEMSAIKIKMAKYNELKAEYDRYSNGRMDEDEIATVSRTDVLDIVEKVVMPNALVSEITVEGNTLGLVLHDITLEDSSKLVVELEKEELIADALVSFATSEFGDDAEIHMMIYMRKVVE